MSNIKKSITKFIIVSSFFLLSCNNKNEEIIKYTQTQIISEFKNDFDDTLEKFRKRKIQFTGVITAIEYPICKNEKSKCTIHFGLTKKNLGGPFTNDFFMISMKEYIDESNIGKEVQLRAEFDSAYRQDNGVVAILLTKGIIIEKQD